MRGSFAVLIFLLASAASAESSAPVPDLPKGSLDSRPMGRDFGIGLSLGAPTGITGKYHLDAGTGLQFGVGGAGHGFLSLHLDYIVSLNELARGDEGFFYLYGGAGLGVGLIGSYHPVFLSFFGAASPVSLNVHVTLGGAWNFRYQPIDVFVEVAPGLLVVPGIGFGWHATVGFRYYI